LSQKTQSFSSMFLSFLEFNNDHKHPAKKPAQIDQKTKKKANQ